MVVRMVRQKKQDWTKSQLGRPCLLSIQRCTHNSHHNLVTMSSPAPLAAAQTASYRPSAASASSAVRFPTVLVSVTTIPSAFY